MAITIISGRGISAGGGRLVVMENMADLYCEDVRVLPRFLKHLKFYFCIYTLNLTESELTTDQQCWD